MSVFQRIWKCLLWLVNALIVLLLASMMLVIATAVFYRYVLFNPIAWAEEFSRYCMIWFAMLGAILALIDNSHVGVIAFVNLLPDQVKIWVQRLGRVLIIAFLGVVFFYSVIHLGSVQGQTSSAMMLPMFVPYMAISVGALLMLLVAVRQLFGIDQVRTDAAYLLEEDPLMDEAPDRAAKKIGIPGR